MKVDVQVINLLQDQYMGKYDISWRIMAMNSNQPIDIDIKVDSAYVYKLFSLGLPMRFATRVFETWASGLKDEKHSIVKEKAVQEGANYVWLNPEE